MDLKDFHVQFGPSNHKMLIRTLERRLITVRDSNIRKELGYILKTLKDELCRGTLIFQIKTSGEESLEKAAESLSQDYKNIMRRDYKYKQVFPKVEKKPKVKKDKKEEDEDEEEEEEKMKVMCDNLFGFSIHNGLLSGWKLTSLMGSIYNNSTNMFCNFWHLNRFGIVPSNYITQGDDTHFKCRFLTQSMFHIGLVNAIGKEAHPKKQFFSTYMTEFLKKLYDLNGKKMDYNPCRMISSILFNKENRKSTSNNKNNMKDIVDVWNLFMIRIPDESRRQHIINKNYA